MNINKLTPSPQQNRVSFQRDSYHRVSQQSGCYVLTNSDEDILYIGQSVNIYQRFMQHLDDPKKTCATSKGRAFWFYWLEWDKVHLNALERGWIHSYEMLNNGELPIMNSQNPPV